MAFIAKRGWRPKHDRFTEKDFQPYVMAIGQVSLAWNDLHEKLALLFWTLMGGGFNRPLMVWNSANFDRPKREMLRAAALSATELAKATHPRMSEDIVWIIDKAGGLEEARNNAIHSPLFRNMTFKILMDGADPVMPNTELENTRAIKLSALSVQKGLLAELRWLRDAALVLRDYAALIDRAISAAGVPWPDRPSLPNRGQKKIRQGRPRQQRPK